MTEQDIDLEAEYNNRARVPEHSVYRRLASRCGGLSGRSARCELDLAYGPGERHRLDLFHPGPGERSGPVVLFIHGGYWQALDKSSASHLARGANLTRPLRSRCRVTIWRRTPTFAEIVAEHRTRCRFRRRADAAPAGRDGTFGGRTSGGLPDGAPRTGIAPTDPCGMPISGLFDLAPLVSDIVNKALGPDDRGGPRG